MLTFGQLFDAIVVANGKNHSPKIPNTPGLSHWKQTWPSRVTHAKTYRSSSDFEIKSGQKQNFLIVGGSASAMDFCRELAPLAENMYQVQREGGFVLPLSMFGNAFVIRVPEVTAYDIPEAVAESHSKNLQDGEPIPATVTLKNGGKLRNIHHVIFCTGYQITLPFMPHLSSDEMPVSKPSKEILVTEGTQYHNLHKDMFYIPDPTLCFVGVPTYNATFVLYDFQAQVVARVLAGHARLPSEEAMRAEYEAKVEKKGFGKKFHVLMEDEVAYVEDLREWVNRDVEMYGGRKIEGHTEKWMKAREEIVKLMNELGLGGK